MLRSAWKITIFISMSELIAHGAKLGRSPSSCLCACTAELIRHEGFTFLGGSNKGFCTVDTFRCPVPWRLRGWRHPTLEHEFKGSVQDSGTCCWLGAHSPSESDHISGGNQIQLPEEIRPHFPRKSEHISRGSQTNFPKDVG